MALSLWQYLLTPSDIDRKHDEDNVLIVNVSIGTITLDQYTFQINQLSTNQDIKTGDARLCTK
jgi:hypothetical protein